MAMTLMVQALRDGVARILAHVASGTATSWPQAVRVPAAGATTKRPRSEARSRLRPT